MFRPLRAMLRDPEAKVLALTAIAVIIIGSVVYMLIEHWSPVDSVYFCVVTLATVGYGDLHPTTDAGKIFTVIYILGGLGIIAAFITELAKHREVGGGRLAAQVSAAGTPMARNAAAAGFGAATDAAAVPPQQAPGEVVDARTPDRDPDSPRTDIGPGG